VNEETGIGQPKILIMMENKVGLGGGECGGGEGCPTVIHERRGWAPPPFKLLLNLPLKFNPFILIIFLR
jgi:hypothetical protein